MNDIKQLVWDGELNVLISIDPSFLMKGSPKEKTVLRIRVPRETYLINYMPFIWSKIRDFLSFDPLNDSKKCFWFEHNGAPIRWNYPVGVLFDGLVKSSLAFVTSSEIQSENVITILRVRLVMGDSLPPTVIPITTSKTQAEKFWFHQWKQVCFILNGSSKAIMSLSVNESRKFWRSIIARNLHDFVEISNKISSSKPRHIPIIIQTHKASGSFNISQPTVRMTGLDTTLKDIEGDIFNAKEEMNADNSIILCQGIEIPWDIAMSDMYLKLRSFDGFLYITLVPKN
ncbi:hypothetical protein SKDZ_16G1260 [Saccharomyces kudriavzevii ZP591]|uniref:Autophagy protein 5 n=1 Tax=Saccharomyces cerevisiae x Saccharomyces kudriavzevii (strain VIN7) TaxID=1095631 RepID=H0H1Y7_SACCK|nr:Atg5p [Saccharomyces cerevisiae x Saccharomyces kudriavzevii VIN7]CAI4053081.1 hypothetical protein SKDZ_16G1260 [Saccharomyces kudriavzevii ZP591]